MKRILNCLLAVMAMVSAQAQSKGPDKAVTPAFTKAIETILGDFPHNYQHITGELVLAQGELEQYASIVTLPGAIQCVVGRYHSELDTTASWQALMFSKDDFTAAAAEYKRLYHRLQQCKLRMVDGSVYYLDGDYEDAAESTDFVTSTLTIQTADERFRRFKVEVELLYQTDAWVVNINMVSKKKDSEIRPDWMEGK
jgi:hypothetical protein